MNHGTPNPQPYQPFQHNNGGQIPQPQGHSNKPPNKPMSKGAKIGWSVLAGAALFVVGAAAGAAGNGTPATDAAASTPQPTVTIKVPGKPAAPVTVTAPPAPAATVTKPAPPAKTVTAEPPEAEAAIVDDGTYEIGSDVKPGKYKSTGSDTCYWARLKNTDGDLDSIITNHLGSGAQVVTIKKSDKAFETTGCGEWRKVS